MARVSYSVRRTPIWIWVLLAISLLLLLLILVTTIQAQRSRQAVVTGPEVSTGNPEDFVEGRRAPVTPTVPVVPEPAPPVQDVTPVPEQDAPPPPPVSDGQGSADQPPGELPESIAFDGRNWQRSGAPVNIDVVTTGQHTDGHIIYHRQNDNPPYDALYIETSPNSGRFYKYVPAAG